MSTRQAFRAIGEREIPPDFDPDYVASRPALRALVDKIPPAYQAAVAQLYRQTAAEAAAIEAAKAKLSTEDLVALAGTGDVAVAQILAIRCGHAPMKTAHSGFSARSRDVIRRLGYDPDKIEADAARELAAQSDPVAAQAELARMAAQMGVSQDDIKKYGGETAARP